MAFPIDPGSVTMADLCNDMNGVGIPQRLADRTLDMGQNYSDSGLSQLCFCPGWVRFKLKSS